MSISYLLLMFTSFQSGPLLSLTWLCNASWSNTMILVFFTGFCYHFPRQLKDQLAMASFFILQKSSIKV